MFMLEASVTKVQCSNPWTVYSRSPAAVFLLLSIPNHTLPDCKHDTRLHTHTRFRNLLLYPFIYHWLHDPIQDRSLKKRLRVKQTWWAHDSRWLILLQPCPPLQAAEQIQHVMLTGISGLTQTTDRMLRQHAFLSLPKASSFDCCL